jgi:hypothetical protein
VKLKTKLGLGLPSISLGLMFVVAPSMHGQITSEIYATIHHSFIVGNATLPAGRYVFGMLPDSQLQIMTARNTQNDAAAEFLVRTSLDAHVPNHSELLFNKYGNKEFLLHVYQTGEQTGVTVLEPSREESRLQKKGQVPTEHTEEQEK